VVHRPHVPGEDDRRSGEPDVTARLRVNVHPGARRERVDRRMADGAWRLEVHAAAEGGRANEAVVQLLAETLGVGRRDVRVASGQSSRRKLIEIDGLAEADVEARLERAAGEDTQAR
jgi:hypothetical protein